MKTTKLICFGVISVLLGITLLAYAMPGVANWRLTWDPNTEPDLAGYKIYYSTTSGAYGDPDSMDVGNVVEFPLTSLPLTDQTLYYFVLTAYDTSENESPFSNEVSHFVDSIIPNAPVNLQIELVITGP